MVQTADSTNTDSTGSEVVVETVDEDSEDDSGTEKDEELSEVSSVGSVLIEGDLSPGDFTDLRSSDRCWVYMTRTENRKKVYCCCGAGCEDCNWRGHRDKSDAHRAHQDLKHKHIFLYQDRVDFYTELVETYIQTINHGSRPGLESPVMIQFTASLCRLSMHAPRYKLVFLVDR